MNDERKQRRFGRKAISVEEARQAVLRHAEPVSIETLGLVDAVRRRAAEDVFAPEPVPHFRRSGMDGYAIRSGDTKDASSANPVAFSVIDNIPCGTVPREAIVSGAAARIMTGAMVPDGADAVVMLEMTEPRENGDETVISVKRHIPSGANVSAVGSDLMQGEPVIRRGERLGPAEIAVLAAVGKPDVTVFRRPKVAILSTGTELLAPGEPLQPGKIRNSNSYMLAAQTANAGGEPAIIESVPDRLDIAAGTIRRLMETDDCDLLITTGGVSVGDYDMMTDFLYEWQGELLFNKIMMRPGSPTSAAVFNGKLLFALSGNPGACFAGFELLVRPAIKKMQGAADPGPASIKAVLDADFPKVNAYTRYIRGKRRVEDGSVFAAPVGEDRSSMLVPGLGADCFIVIPPGGQGVARGTLVDVLPFDDGKG
ncbi:molybdopterin molybdotransferase MoeA [Paenibacillus alkalitolerans]|uniref:molybdopterin molybdotransferase MoeA n=1 Tax=Paenibacillus alkalitolerans TaxID=2799335 RepID=UPI001F2B589F|nr:gephyrin-like molybdotransferase Glp [Paenibacillus alkalitolerans]